MRFIPTRIHGIMDYTVSTILFSGPAYLGKKYETTKNLFLAAGLGATAYSLFTNYEGGAIKKLPMSAHLTLDVISGLLLTMAPFLLQVNKRERLPLILAGLVEVSAGMLTKRVAGA